MNADGTADPALDRDVLEPKRPGLGLGLAVTQWADVSVGESQACAIDAARGDAICWGSSALGELGKSAIVGQSRVRRTAPTQRGDRFITIEANAFATCALTEQGRVECWGAQAESGAASDLTDESAAWIQLECRDRACCALNSTNDLSCWANGEGGSVRQIHGASRQGRPRPRRSPSCVRDPRRESQMLGLRWGSKRSSIQRRRRKRREGDRRC